MNKNPLMQKVNFFVAVGFIAVFGIFLTIKIDQAIQLLNPINTNASTLIQN
jgi:hypothetical protein